MVASAESAIENAAKHATYFRVGKLRFGFHGVLGIVSTIVTMMAFVFNTDQLLVLLTVILTTILGVDALQLLDQVPLQSRITEYIIAPHREAFQRTITMVLYINLRICGEMSWVPPNYAGGYHALLVCCWVLFVPLHSSFCNGNTWLFVVPMFLGVSADLTQHLLLLLTEENQQLLVGCCQAGFISVQMLLLTQFSALIIAFLFTLAFRTYINIRTVYFIAVFIVSLLLVQVAVSISAIF